MIPQDVNALDNNNKSTSKIVISDKKHCTVVVIVFASRMQKNIIEQNHEYTPLPHIDDEYHGNYITSKRSTSSNDLVSTLKRTQEMRYSTRKLPPQ